MDDDAVWAAIDAERRSLADLFTAVSGDQWDLPSLCSGWTVRHVLAHLTLAHASPLWAARNAARAGFRFDHMIRVTALRHAATPTDELVSALRGMVGSRRHAPGVSCREPLIDVLVHGQDVAVPLGIPRTMPAEAAGEALRRVLTAPWVIARAFPARRQLAGRTVVATDADVEIGTGPKVEARAQDLLLVLTGRPSPLSTTALGGLGRHEVEKRP